MSFECGKPFVSEGVEFVVLTIKGQSFMLHQIRKMVAFVIAVVRGNASKEDLESAFGLDKV